MKTIPILGTSLNALSPAASAQQRVNVFYELHSDNDKGEIIVRGTPGLTTFVTLPQAPIRGMLAVNNYLYVVADNGLYQIGATGNFALLGYFGDSGESSPCKLINNPTQLMIVDGSNGGWIYQFSDLENVVTAVVTDIQTQLIDIITLSNEFVAQGAIVAAASSTPTPVNTGVLPRVITPRLGAYRGNL